MHVDRLRWLVREGKHLTLDGVTEIGKAAPGLLQQVENLKAGLVRVGYLDVTNLGTEAESGRPPRYFECRLCGDWNDEQKHIEHADGCPLK